MWQFLIFALIGVFNTGFDFVLWRLLLKIIKSDWLILGLKLNRFAVAQVFSYSVAIGCSYTLNKLLAFKKEGSLLAFLAINLLALVLSTTIIGFLTNRKDLILKLVPKFHPKLDSFLNQHFYNIVKLSVVFLTMVISYFGYKFLVFA